MNVPNKDQQVILFIYNNYCLYSKKIQNDHIQHKNKINGNVCEPHTEGKNCDKRHYY